jgi:hypothetical protein
MHIHDGKVADSKSVYTHKLNTQLLIVLRALELGIGIFSGKTRENPHFATRKWTLVQRPHRRVSIGQLTIVYTLLIAVFWTLVTFSSGIFSSNGGYFPIVDQSYSEIVGKHGSKLLEIQQKIVNNGDYLVMMIGKLRKMCKFIVY